MRFFDKFIRIFKKTDYKPKEKDISNRIYNLECEKHKLDSQLKQINTFNTNLSWYKIELTSQKPKDINSFTPYKLKKITNMKDLQKKREYEEAEKIHKLKSSIRQDLNRVHIFIDKEDTDEASKLLYTTAPFIKDLKDKDLEKLFYELKDKIVDINENIRIKEKKRKEEEAKQIHEEEIRKKEIERQRKEREEAEYIRKEKEKIESVREYEEKLRKEEQRRISELLRLRNLGTTKKNNANEFIKYLQNQQVQYFYHFTDKKNLISIKESGGLCSWKYCSENKIHISNSGGDDESKILDQRYNLEDYVRLSFCSNHPMAYRKYKEGAQLVLLKIKIEVAVFADTMFSDKNATDSSHSHGGSFEDLKKVNIQATKLPYLKKDDVNFKYHQAECMVKTFVPIEYIVNINNPEIMNFE